MSNAIQVALWLMAGLVLVTLLARRRKRKALR